MSAQTEERLPEVRELSREQGRELFDRKANEYFGISGDEFIRRVKRGDFSEHQRQHGDFIVLSMLMPRDQ